MHGQQNVKICLNILSKDNGIYIFIKIRPVASQVNSYGQVDRQKYGWRTKQT